MLSYHGLRIRPLTALSDAVYALMLLACSNVNSGQQTLDLAAVSPAADAVESSPTTYLMLDLVQHNVAATIVWKCNNHFHLSQKV